MTPRFEPDAPAPLGLRLTELGRAARALLAAALRPNRGAARAIAATTV